MAVQTEHVDLTFNLHDFAVLWAGNECMVQVFPCIPPFHFKLYSFLFDLAVIFNASHGHAANAIKRQLQYKDLLLSDTPFLWCVRVCVQADGLPVSASSSAKTN